MLLKPKLLLDAHNITNQMHHKILTQKDGVPARSISNVVHKGCFIK